MEKNSFAVQETKKTPIRSLDWEDPLEEDMATHSSIFAWKILWTEEPGRLPFIDGYLIEIVIILCVYGFKLFSFLKYFSLCNEHLNFFIIIKTEHKNKD